MLHDIKIMIDGLTILFSLITAGLFGISTYLVVLLWLKLVWE